MHSAADVGKSKVGFDSTSVDFIAGTIGGIAGLIVGHPFDTVKVRFQTPGIRAKYRSTFDALGTIIREERFIGLYKGITSPLSTGLLRFIKWPYIHFLPLLHENSAGTIECGANINAGCHGRCGHWNRVFINHNAS